MTVYVRSDLQFYLLKNRREIMNWTKQQTFFLILIIGIYALSWKIQADLALNWDVGHILNVTDQLLAGGKYVNDFITPNPPMILYLSIPPVILNKLFNVKMVFSIRIYIFLLSSVSLFICYLFIQKIFSKEDTFYAYVFITTLAVIFFVLPMYEFGQRDCLMFILVMPYLLAVTYQLQGHTIPTRYAVLVGLLAGAGLGIKPYFVLTPIMIESYIILYKKQWLAWARVDSITMITLLAAYILTSLVYHTEYYTIIVPYLLRYFHPSTQSPWSEMLTNSLTIFCYLAAAFYIILYPKNPYKLLGNILLVALISFLCIYLMQYTVLYYHQLPSFSVAILLFGQLFCFFAREKDTSKIRYMLIALLATICFIMVNEQSPYMWIISLIYPSIFFCYFIILFTFLLYLIQEKKDFIKIVIYVSFVIATAILFFSTMQNTSFYLHRFALTVSLLLSLFILFASSESGRALHSTIIVVLAIIVFSIPACMMVIGCSNGLVFKQNVLNELINFMHTQPRNQSIYTVTRHTFYGSPLIYYTDARLKQRFECLWMARDLSKRIYLQGDNAVQQYIRNNKDKYFFINIIADDLKRFKPDLIFLEVSKNNMVYLNNDNKITTTHFDFLKYFQENTNFKNEWKAYTYLTIINGDKFLSPFPYKIQIYKRMK